MENNEVEVTDHEKMTEWTNEPSLLDLKADLQITQSSHDAAVTKVQQWRDIRNLENAKAPKKRQNRSAIQPKLVRRQNEWRYAALSEPFLASEDQWEVSPTGWEDKEGAIQNEKLLNYQFRSKIGRVAFIDEYVRTGVDEGTVYVKPGWIYESEMVDKEVAVFEYTPIQDSQQADALQQAMQISQTNPQAFMMLPEEIQASVEYSMEVGAPYLAVEVGTEMIEEEVTVKNEPTLEILQFENVYLDPAAQGKVEKANFAVISFETSHAKLKKDGRYTNLDQVNWSGNTPLTNPDHETGTDETAQYKDDLRRPVVAYEYWGFWDIDKTGILKPIVATWIGDTLIRMEENPYPDKKIPLIVVTYMPVRKEVAGEPDAALLEDNQDILGAVTRGMIDLLGRSANGQQGIAKGMLDVVNKRRYDRGENYEFNPQMTPDMGIKEHKYPDLPVSAFNMLTLQNQEAEAISGVKSFSGGISGDAYGDVAAGIRGMLDATAKREMGILRRFANGMEEIGRKMISMNQAFLSEEEVVRVTNDEFVTVRLEDIQGEYDLKVDITTPEIEEAKAGDLGFMLQTMGNTLPFPVTKMIMTEFARLKRLPTLEHALKTYQPEPDPVAEKLQELEIAKLEVEIAETRAKAMLAQAKARTEGSTADMKDLDFLEQESGAKQARDIQRQEAQAEANQMLNISKALLASPDKRPRDQDLMTAIAIQQASKAS